MSARNRSPVVSGSRPVLGSANVMVQRGKIQAPGASPRCGVPPGRNVERENRCSARVRPFDKAQSLTNRRGFQTVAYERVQDGVGVLSVKVGNSDLLSRSGLEHLVLEGGDFSQMFRVSKA